MKSQNIAKKESSRQVLRKNLPILGTANFNNQENNNNKIVQIFEKFQQEIKLKNQGQCKKKDPESDLSQLDKFEKNLADY